MFVYLENGVLAEVFKYDTQAEIWGKPIAVSENAKLMIFKKANSNVDISIVEISVTGLKFIRSLKIDTLLYQHMNTI